MNSTKFKLIGKALKLLKPLSKLYNTVKNIVPKRSKSNEMDELRAEIESLKKDLKRHEDKIQELTTEAIQKKEVKQNRSEWIQAEMYVSVVVSGKDGGSESGGYVLVNLPADEYNEMKKDFHDMPTPKLKKLLGIQDDRIVKNVTHGETLSNIQERFIEIDGNRQPYNAGVLK